MARNDTRFFYSGLLTLTANFSDNAFLLKLGACRMVKISSTGAAQVSFDGGSNTDGDIAANETVSLEHFQTNKIAIKGTGTAKIWAY